MTDHFIASVLASSPLPAILRIAISGPCPSLLSSAPPFHSSLYQAFPGCSSSSFIMLAFRSHDQVFFFSFYGYIYVCLISNLFLKYIGSFMIKKKQHFYYFTQSPIMLCTLILTEGIDIEFLLHF